MSSVISPPYLFAAGFYASIALLVLTIVFAVFRNKRGFQVSFAGLLAAICFVVLVIVFGDWQIPDCHDADGNLLSVLPQCRFP